MTQVTVLGRDQYGVIAESHGMRYYLTPCCYASAKGLESYIGCRSCYHEVDPILGDVPDFAMVWTPETGVTFTPRPVEWVEIYGDGIAYDEFITRERAAGWEKRAS